MKALALLVLGGILAGCLSPAEERSEDEADYRVSGSFTREFDGDDASDLEARLAPWYDRVAILESYPAQYSLGNLDAEGCEEVRAILLSLPYVATAGGCHRDALLPGDPDAPVSSGS